MVLDSLRDFLGPDRRGGPPIVLTMACEGSSFVNGGLTTNSSLYLAPIDSAQMADSNTTKVFSHWNDRSRCSGSVVVRDAQGNESPVRKSLALQMK